MTRRNTKQPGRVAPVNNYITVRNIVDGLRPHVVTFDDADPDERERAHKRALQHANGRPLAKVASIWRSTEAPLASLRQIGAELAYVPAYRPPRRNAAVPATAVVE